MSLIPINGNYYQIIQRNGQRIVTYWDAYANSNYEFPEIYIGRIPHILTEIELMNYFTSIGPVWKFRLMMNFSGQNRGFGYLQYIFEQHYRIAMGILNGKQIIPGHSLSACKSRNNCTLVMGGLKGNLNPSNIIKELQSIVNLKHVTINLEKGYIRYYLTFPTHREAALGRRKILSEMYNYGRDLWIKWAVN